tara:strand:- start:168 stop:410 length:243 start_codon:yes stop_codon:yes gene_type:complete
MMINKMIKLRPRNLVRYESFVLVGLILAAGALIKILGVYDFSSDWFWFLAGLGLVVQGTISLIKQKKFDKKFKIIERTDN